MISKKHAVRNNRGTTNISSTSLKGRYGGSRSVEAYKKGPWTKEEDALLIEYVKNNGDRHWNSVQKMGLLRCGKSCRLRWMNHLRPDLKKGAFSSDEEIVVIELHRKLGNKWSKIADKLPGRTDNEVKNFWNTKIKRKMKNNTTNIVEENIPQSHRGNINILTYQNLTPCNNAIPINAPMNFNKTLEPTTEIHSMTSLVMHHDPITPSFNGSSYNCNLFLEEGEYQNTFLPQSFPNGSHMSFNNISMTPSMKGNEGGNVSPLKGMANALRVEPSIEKTTYNYDHDKFFTFDTYNQTSGTKNATNDLEMRSNKLCEETEFMDDELSSLLLSFSSY